ncbi:hypothetical protein EC844_102213 [Acinetobacter calcoaceticus]|uniref:Uncharacterized protein n=1 Tax=Acinetobacter calcoaceticus TaxID=471 RepID=A0A4R1Y476_ACICA|nr:hypothetical protein EC844_102213 [Acinetobacter calcoaceticus]
MISHCTTVNDSRATSPFLHCISFISFLKLTAHPLNQIPSALSHSQCFISVQGDLSKPLKLKKILFQSLKLNYLMLCYNIAKLM